MPAPRTQARRSSSTPNPRVSPHSPQGGLHPGGAHFSFLHTWLAAHGGPSPQVRIKHLLKAGSQIIGSRHGGEHRLSTQSAVPSDDSTHVFGAAQPSEHLVGRHSRGRPASSCLHVKPLAQPRVIPVPLLYWQLSGTQKPVDTSQNLRGADGLFAVVSRMDSSVEGLGGCRGCGGRVNADGGANHGACFLCLDHLFAGFGCVGLAGLSTSARPTPPRAFERGRPALARQCLPRLRAGAVVHGSLGLAGKGRVRGAALAATGGALDDTLRALLLCHIADRAVGAAGGAPVGDLDALPSGVSGQGK